MTLIQCPECGAKFEREAKRGTPRQFCTPEHKRAFFRLMAKRGAVLAPLALAWLGGKHKRSDNSSYALTQMAALVDVWRAEDRDAGRDAGLIVTRKRASGWIAADLA